MEEKEAVHEEMRNFIRDMKTIKRNTWKILYQK